MVLLLIGINPKKEISNNIKKIRKYVFKKYNLNVYNNNPHITLFVNSFKNISNLNEILLKLLKKYNEFNIKIDGLGKFDFGALTKSSTILYKIKNNNSLKKIQKDIMINLNKIRTKKQENIMLKQNIKYSNKHIKNIKKYGYPFDYNDWIFHLSIVHVKKNLSKKILDEIKIYNIKKTFKVNYISIYKYERKKLRFYKKYKLAKDL